MRSESAGQLPERGAEQDPLGVGAVVRPARVVAADFHFYFRNQFAIGEFVRGTVMRACSRGSGAVSSAARGRSRLWNELRITVLRELP